MIEIENAENATKACPNPNSMDWGSGPFESVTSIAEHNGMYFRAPRDLSVKPTPLRRVLLVGECILDGWANAIAAQHEGVPCDRLHFNQLPESLARPPEDYDFQVISIPYRSVLPEKAYFRLTQTNLCDFETLFHECCKRLEMLLDSALRFNRFHKMLTFVANFFVPIQNPAGRLFPRYDLRNQVHFAERLNQRLSELAFNYTNVFLLDIDQISATMGKRYIQDDFVSANSHGSMLDDYGYHLDQARIEPPVRVTEYYDNRRDTFLAMVWAELLAGFRTIRQVDGVKMIIMDLDDTLWRGLAGEKDVFSAAEMTEGWPLGVAEALMYAKQRGIMLAIAPYILRRILLWGPETQVVTVTKESGGRTEMMQRQVERESERLVMSRTEFLNSLHVQVQLLPITSATHSSFDRIFELINKTNQFNTTGRRWAREELLKWLDTGNQILAFSVEDRFSKYGLIGVLLYAAGRIEQFVMSCRVLGMDIELAVISEILKDSEEQGIVRVTAKMMHTELNGSCRDVWERARFSKYDDGWLRNTSHAAGMTPHVTVIKYRT